MENPAVTGECPLFPGPKGSLGPWHILSPARGQDGVLVTVVLCRICWGSRGWVQPWEQSLSPALGTEPNWGKAPHGVLTQRSLSGFHAKSFCYFCPETWDLSVFHANFKLVRCFSWAVYRLFKGPEGLFLSSKPENFTQGDSPGAQAFCWLFSNAQLTKEGEFCRLNAASQLGLTTLVWGNCSKDFR